MDYQNIPLISLYWTHTMNGGEFNNPKREKGFLFDRRVIVDGSFGIHRGFHFHDINRRSRDASRNDKPESTKGKVYIVYTGLYILVSH